ncbi:c-type cytochrome domain-containing protein [Ideonella sp. A 288]|uniref:c-type cytochrome domain-containing protein n=1 Tax=Ideonella sp. A 288 TaxID=1962181 RepID=UPI000B4BEF5B
MGREAGEVGERWCARGAASLSAPPLLTAPVTTDNVTWAHVEPVLARRCAKCHTDNGQMGAPPEGYRLTSHAATIDSSDRARVVPGRPEASELVRRIRGQARPRMPSASASWRDLVLTLSVICRRWRQAGS